jgi:hypothetical protein
MLVSLFFLLIFLFLFSLITFVSVNHYLPFIPPSASVNHYLSLIPNTPFTSLFTLSSSSLTFIACMSAAASYYGEKAL